MKCIFCGKGKTEVINSRKGKSDVEVWRRRECPKCKEIFTTVEHFSHDSLFVVKRNLARKRFVYEKLFTSILYAVSGGKGSDMGDDALHAREITRKVIEELLLFKSKYVSSKDIIHATYRELEKVGVFLAKKYAMYSAYRLKVVEGKK